MTRWYIPILEDDTIPGGSALAYASHYVRPDCVRKFIAGIAERKYFGVPVKEIWEFTEKQFWDYEIWNQVHVRKYGRKVWERAKSC